MRKNLNANNENATPPQTPVIGTPTRVNNFAGPRGTKTSTSGPQDPTFPLPKFKHPKTLTKYMGSNSHRKV